MPPSSPAGRPSGASLSQCMTGTLASGNWSSSLASLLLMPPAQLGLVKIETSAGIEAAGALAAGGVIMRADPSSTMSITVELLDESGQLVTGEERVGMYMVGTVLH